MIDKKDFKKIIKELEKFDERREKLIKESRKLLKFSKRLIYALNRGNDKEIKILLKNIKNVKDKIDNLVKKDIALRFEGSYSDAMQEYCEAMCYYSFIKDNRIPKISELKVKVEDYLCGLCDLTGELERRAVVSATKNNLKEVEKIKKVIDEIYACFLELNLRNGLLRRKFDSIKWNLKKVEEIFYDLKLRKE